MEGLSRVTTRSARVCTNGLLALLRRAYPIISTRRYAVVVRADDVREVLSDSAHFPVSMYGPKMIELTGPFVLGIDDNSLYRHDHAALRTAMRFEDVPDIGARIVASARARLGDAAGDTIDVLEDYADRVVVDVMSDYLGAPGPDPATQVQWARSLFQHIFLNATNNRTVRAQALIDAAAMRSHLDMVIAARKAALDSGEACPDDVLTRLLRTGDLFDLAIRHNLIGIIAGWIPTVSKAFAVVIEELLNRPQELRGAQQAAQNGDQDLVAAYVFEALRFRPQTWALLRECADDHEIATRTGHARTIRKGAKVLLATYSAMFDEQAVARPREFRLDRPWDNYLHFGYGLHTCFGEAINRVQLPALVMVLLEGADIERMPGSKGHLQWTGPYPAHLRVKRSPPRGA